MNNYFIGHASNRRAQLATRRGGAGAMMNGPGPAARQ